MRRVRAIDSHTGGEPTRVVIDGGPSLGTGSAAAQRRVFETDFDSFRSAIVNEPRGSDVIVGALLCPPSDTSCVTGVIFFNNVGYLGMCGHGAIGLVATLSYLGRIMPGSHRIETPVGVVTATLLPSGEVAIENVASYRHAVAVTVDVPGYGLMTGDVAWGGNWFFLVNDHGQRIALDNIEQLTNCSWAVRQALTRHGITGRDGGEIDHIEFFGAPASGGDSRSFVLCPGKAYDRSPCGTGTSAKIACLAADGKLAEGAIWRQESIVGSIFEASYRRQAEAVVPTIQGAAYITADATLLLDPRDPFCMGIR